MSKTSASCFVQGIAGQTYVRRHIQELLEHGFVSYERNAAGDFIEGGDSKITYNRFGREVDMAGYTLDGAVDVKGIGHEIDKIVTGGLEVKTISNFTFRTNDNNELSGTLPFELWHDENRTSAGWLLALISPELRLKLKEEQKIHAVQPALFCFLLVSYLGPYACVMFENFQTLSQRLKELAEEKGFQLAPLSKKNQNGIPMGKKAETWREDDQYLIGRCWHVPFNRLSDLATVTLIGDPPLIKRSIQLRATEEYIGLQRARYGYLRHCGGERNVISAEAQSEKDFYPADETHIYADILQNMRIIEQLRQEEYPYLYYVLQSRGMRQHLSSALYNMYSHEYPTKINDRFVCFYQAKKYLHEWSRETGVIGSSFSWQSHIIFLTDAGLLKKYVEKGPKMFRSAPLYTGEVLRVADRKARDYVEAGIKLNNFTKDEVIKVSGQERADFLFYGDARIISAMKDTVDELFVSIARRILEKQACVLPTEIESAVVYEIKKRYWVDPRDENPDIDKKMEFKKAYVKIRRLKLRYNELSIMIPCQFRELTREEKNFFQIPLQSRKKYFIRSTEP